MNLKKELIAFVVFLFTITICRAQDTTMKAPDTVVSVNEPVKSIVPDKPSSDQQHYKLNLAVDIPVTAITTGTTLYGFSKIYNKERLTPEEVAGLDPRNVNRFDRSATKHYSE